MHSIRPPMARWLRPALVLLCMVSILVAAPACDCSNGTGENSTIPE